MSMGHQFISYCLQFFYDFLDLFFRIRNHARRKLGKKKRYSNSRYKSDSQETFYESAVSNINSNTSTFRRFRRLYDYREILEHVNYSLGRRYLDVINRNEIEIWNSLTEFKKNDSLGKPRRYIFKQIGLMSPTTLRYIAVATDLRREFDFSKIKTIVEIGGGYGGQVSILNSLHMFKEYFIFDLPNVQKLIKNYVSAIGVKGIFFSEIGNQIDRTYDLVISNYAFSELPRALQDEYLEKVIRKSQRGFMLMNSGKKNETGRSDGKISIKELQKLIPNLRELPEQPLTSPDNYLLVWES